VGKSSLWQQTRKGEETGGFFSLGIQLYLKLKKELHLSVSSFLLELRWIRLSFADFLSAH